MPYPFVLPTTSAFSFSSSFICDSHPSLPLSASTYRGVVRDTLKKHKRLPPPAQASNLSLVISSINGYLPYLLAVDAGLGGGGVPPSQSRDAISVKVKCTPAIEWRPTLSDGPALPGKESARVRVTSIEHEVAFVLASLANAYTLLARASLQPLYVISIAPVGAQERLSAITTATRHLLDAASVWDYLATHAERTSISQQPLPCVDIAPTTVKAQCSLALAEATLLAVLKDDPYPAAVAQGRNENDREWMFKAPDLPKVRAHLFARLCLAASEHAAKASALCKATTGRAGGGRLNDGFLRYLNDLRRASRAKACRFFGIDAELGGQTGNAIGWLQAGLQELGVEQKEAKKGGFGLGRLKKDWTEKREDRRVEKGASWGADAGKLEEIRVIEMLLAKWGKMNDTMNTQIVPPVSSLLMQMPSGREIHTVKRFEVPCIDSIELEAMRAPPDRPDDFGHESSDDEDVGQESHSPAGAFPGTREEYNNSESSYY